MSRSCCNRQPVRIQEKNILYSVKRKTAQSCDTPHLLWNKKNTKVLNSECKPGWRLSTVLSNGLLAKRSVYSKMIYVNTGLNGLWIRHFPWSFGSVEDLCVRVWSLQMVRADRAFADRWVRPVSIWYPYCSHLVKQASAIISLCSRSRERSNTCTEWCMERKIKWTVNILCRRATLTLHYHASQVLL